MLNNTWRLKLELSHGCAAYCNHRRRINRRGDGSRSRAAGTARHRHRARGSGFRTTGRNHCLLHSGGRYCVTDHESAIECIDENMILRRIMPDLLELNDGLFVAITEADFDFKQRFLEGCAACHIPARDIPVQRALAIEPFLNPKLLAAVQVPDGVFAAVSLLPRFLGDGSTEWRCRSQIHGSDRLRLSGQVRGRCESHEPPDRRERNDRR